MQIAAVKRFAVLTAQVMAALSMGAHRPSEVQQDTSESCSVRDVHIEVESQTSPVRLADVRYTTSVDGPAYADVLLTNVSHHPIKRLAFILEFKNGSAKRISQVPFAIRSGLSSASWPWPIDAEHEENIGPDPLASGQVRRVGALTTIRSTGCPASVRVTALWVETSDGQVGSYAEPAWTLPPILNYFPARLPQTSIPHTGYASTIAILATISEGGRIVHFQPAGQTQASDARKLSDLLAQWEFLPALKEGKATEYSLTLVFVFLPTADARPPLDLGGLEPPFLVMRAAPAEYDPTSWEFFSGWRGGDSRLK